jgi:hypothetical protein
MTKHKTTISAKCPQGASDVYEADFETNRLMPVEVIQAAIECFTKFPTYQEELTCNLAKCLLCRVTLKGSHGQFETVTSEGSSSC